MLTDPLNGYLYYGTAYQTRSISLHSGTQPTANQVVSGWTNYCSTNSTYLAVKDIIILETATASFTLNGITTGQALRSGVATWAIIYDNSGYTSATTTASLNLAVGGTPIMVVPVSDINTTTGVIKLSNATLVANSTFTVTDFTMILTNP